MGNLGTKYVLLGIAMATIVGVYAITTFAPTTLTTTSTANLPYLVGHLTVEVRDSQGNMKSYLQTDNFLTDEGFECALVRLSNVSANLGCPFVAGGDPGIWKFISLSSNATDSAVTDTTAGYDIGSEVAREEGKTDSPDATSFTVTHTFVTTDSATSDFLDEDEVVVKTALFDDGTIGDGNMLAIADLSSTTVVEGDEVTVIWTISET